MNFLLNLLFLLIFSNIVHLQNLNSNVTSNTNELHKERALNLFKTLSSLRGTLRNPIKTLVWLGSMAIGTIVLLAFYESPLSPLPVPPLPDPPVGRFPPEHPIWPPPPKRPLRYPSSNFRNADNIASSQKSIHTVNKTSAENIHLKKKMKPKSRKRTDRKKEKD